MTLESKTSPKYFVKISAEKLLLLTARTELNSQQADTARQLAAEIEDWDTFVSIATRKLSITFTYKNLATHCHDVVPSKVLHMMHRLSQKSSMNSLKIAAAQINFHKTCIQPIEADHVYLKGLALYSQFNVDIAYRFCRDVDVLVDKKSFKKVINCALENGYRILLEPKPLVFAESPRDERFAINHAEVVNLVGKDGVLIEVHRRLTKLSLKFDLDFAFSTSEKIRLSGVEMNTLAKPLHFVYVCYHHTRHFWSHLHWLADLHILAHAPDCERDDVEQISEQMGIRPTIDAAYEFDELASQPDLWSSKLNTEIRGRQLLELCLNNLKGGLELEYEMKADKVLGDFISEWQYSRAWRHRLWSNSWRRRLQPTTVQYIKRSLPPYLHWLYVLQNATTLIRNGLKIVWRAPALAKHVFRRTPEPSNETRDE